MTRPDFTLARELEAALSWWRAAGVDCDFHDDATVWLDAPPAPADLHRAAVAGPEVGPQARPAVPSPAPGAPLASPPPPDRRPVPTRRDLLGESPPKDLAAFREWWMTAPALADGQRPRVPPRGKAGARLMVIVSDPEEGDEDRLLSGPSGRLLANILIAMGLDESDVYFASALPCHTPVANLGELAASGMQAVLDLHVALVAPARLLVMGTGLAPAFEAGRSGEGSDGNGVVSGRVPVMISESLESLMASPRLKARFWRRWMEWSVQA